jgi:hypothetical protein
MSEPEANKLYIPEAVKYPLISGVGELVVGAVLGLGHSALAESTSQYFDIVGLMTLAVSGLAALTLRRNHQRRNQNNQSVEGSNT